MGSPGIRKHQSAQQAMTAKTNSAGWEQQTAKMQRCLLVRVVHYNMTSISSGAVLSVRSFEYR